MPIDIGAIIKFRQPGEDASRLPKISLNAILNVPVVVLKWESHNSRFRDGNPDGVFVELEIKMPDGNGFRVNTGSTVIMSQLDEIAKEYPDGTEFTCVFKRYGKFYKMFPAAEVSE